MEEPYARATFAAPGGEVTLPGGERGERLYEAAASEVVPRLAKQMHGAMGSGRQVSVGKTTLSSAGVLLKKGWVPWSDISEFELKPNGMLVIVRYRPEWTFTFPLLAPNLVTVPHIAKLFADSAEDVNVVHLGGVAVSKAEPEESERAVSLPKDTFGMPERDPYLGEHLCTLPPFRPFGWRAKKGKVALYSRGLRDGKRVVGLDSCIAVMDRARVELLNGAYQGTSHMCLIGGSDNTRAVITCQNDEGHAFMKMVMGFFVPRLASRFLDEYRAKGHVELGTFQVTREGMARGRRGVLFSEVDRHVVVGGQVHVGSSLTGDVRFSFSLDESNAQVLLAMLPFLLQSI